MRTLIKQIAELHADMWEAFKTVVDNSAALYHEHVLLMWILGIIVVILAFNLTVVSVLYLRWKRKYRSFQTEIRADLDNYYHS